MKVIILGCGRVGSELSIKLEEAGHEISVIDRNHQAFRRLPREFRGQKVVGVGVDRDHLIEAGIEETDGFAAVTSGDNTNILAARIARENFNVPHVVARIYDPRRASIYQRLGIPTVATVAWTTQRIMARMFPTDQAPNWLDSSAKIALVSREITNAWTGKKLSDLNSPGQWVVSGVTRLGEGTVISERMVGQDGDRLHFVVNADKVKELEDLIAKGTH